ncbi:transcriptional regulator Kaiso-like isoform X2 [Artemia franciscana]
MEQKELCLKWNNYLDVFHGAFLSLLNSEHFTDVTLACDSQSIKCHRLVLSSFSSYFETLLLGMSHPHPIIILKDVKFDDLLSLVKFMYTGEVTVPQAQTSSLVKVAEMLKVKGLGYPDETVNQTQKPIYLSQNTQMAQPAKKRNRIDTASENSFLAEDSSSNLEPPVADTSNDKLVHYPAESISSVYKTGIAACNSLKVKDEFAVGIDKGRNDSSSEFEDDGEHSGYSSEKLIENRILVRSQRMPNVSLNFSEVEETFPDFSQDILSHKHEDVSLRVPAGVSGQLTRNLNPSEFQSNIPENEKIKNLYSKNGDDQCFGITNCDASPKQEDNTLIIPPSISTKLGIDFRSPKLDLTTCKNEGIEDLFPNEDEQMFEITNPDLSPKLEVNTLVSSPSIATKLGKDCDSPKLDISACKNEGIYASPPFCNNEPSNISAKSEIELSKHIKIHSGLKPYECTTCKKKFSSSSHLSRHKKLHTGEKPYECVICKKKFSQGAALNTHRRIHTGEKPYECVICKKKFSDYSNLIHHRRIHSRKIHSEEESYWREKSILDKVFKEF